MKKVFIDGSAGTTGLRLWDRLSTREDLELIRLKESERKDPAARKQALNACDIACLCLPDDAAREAVGLIENEHVTVLDTSTAHRTAPGWVYGERRLPKTLHRPGALPFRAAMPVALLHWWRRWYRQESFPPAHVYSVIRSRGIPVVGIK